MKKIQAKKIASKALKAIFSEYKNKGMVSIYLWGSVTRDDFEPATSDIDVIAVVDDTFNLNERVKIKERLEANNPEIREFGFQCVFLSELNGGARKSILAKLQEPGYLLKSFSQWELVSGHKFNRADFTVPDLTDRGMVEHNVAEAKRALANLDDPGRKPNANRIDLVKSILMLIHWRSVIDKNHRQLDLNRLPFYALPTDRRMSKALLKLREMKCYQGDSFDKLLPEIVAFLEATEKDRIRP